VKTAASFVRPLALAGIGSLAFATLTPQATFAAPAITLKGTFYGPNGATPSAALTSDGNGKFYGTTTNGGDNGVGAIFEFDPSGSGSVTLKGSFNNANGAGPSAALTSAGNGKFYGTTPFGGDNGVGGIFEFDPSGSGSITLKSSFSIGGANGAYPYAALTPAGNGNFYGITPNYSTNSNGVEENYYGTIFEFDPSGSGSITLKSSFSYDTLYGTTPVAALTSDGNGKFYGSAAGVGGNLFGTIFEFDPSGSGSITLKGSFDGANGAYPIAALTSAGNGKFYGTTSEGGMNNAGVIFEFDPGADSEPTPTPLPLMGAGAAFGWSRRLRRRIQAVRPVFPVGL